MVEGRQFLIQSASPDWIRPKAFLSDLCGSAVNLHQIQPFLYSSAEIQENSGKESAMKEKSKGVKENKKAPQLSLKEKRKLKKEKKNK